MIITEKIFNDVYPNKSPNIFSASQLDLPFDDPFKCDGFQYLVDNCTMIWNKILPIVVDGIVPKRSSSVTDLIVEEDIYLSTHLSHPAETKDKAYKHGIICGNCRIFVLEDLDIDYEILQYSLGVYGNNYGNLKSNTKQMMTIFIGNRFDESNKCIIKFIYDLVELLFVQKFHDIIPFNNYPENLIVVSPNLSDISTIRFIAEYYITIFRAINSILLDDVKIGFDDIIESRSEHFIFDKDILKELYEYACSVNRNKDGNYKEIIKILKKLYTTITCN